MIGNKKQKGKVIGSRNGIKIYSTLKGKTPLKAKTKMKVITPKQIKKNHTWSEITNKKIVDLNGICQWCGQYGERHAKNFLSGHHIIKRRYNIHTEENCYVCHYFSCHLFIEQNEIDVRIYPTKKDWEMRNETDCHKG